MTIEDLKKRGLRVYISHKRPYCVEEKWTTDDGIVHSHKACYPLLTKRQAKDEFELDGNFIKAHGGQTTITVYEGEKHLATATTECSKHDAFNRKRALQIVLGRIEKQINE